MVSSIEKVLSVLSCSKRRREDVKGRRNTAGRRIEYGTGQSNYCEINLNFFSYMKQCIIYYVGILYMYMVDIGVRTYMYIQVTSHKG